MSIHLYNTLTRAREVFEPADPRRVTMYVCGPTVYSRPHIGNARPAVIFDVLARLLRSRYGLVYVRNITDIDDKINAAACEAGLPISDISSRYLDFYHQDMEALGVLPPDIEPRATDHLPGIIEMIRHLVAAGHAYEAQGHVLFDIHSFEAYGQLSRRDRQELLAGARVEVADYKKNPGDFVLWKPSTEELPGWESPWGRGRPGWHIECSVMAGEHLGRTIDIHGGGNDLIFPHHENEIAQSTCAHDGEIFARYWLHNGFVNVDSTKMSKSLGNIVTVCELLEQAPGEAIRLALISAHYRQPLEWNDEVLTESCRKLDRLYGTLRDIQGWQQHWSDVDADEHFLAALEDDLNTPRALAALFDLARAANSSADEQRRIELAARLRASAELLGLLGSDAQQWFQTEPCGAISKAEIEQLIEARETARSQRDFVTADRIRAQLETAGVSIEDSAQGTRWRRTC